MPGNAEQDIIDAMAKRIVEETDKSIMQGHEGIWTSDDYKKKAMMQDNARDWQKQIMNDWQEVRKQQDPLRKIQAELDEMKVAVRKLSILLDSDLPDKESFEKYKMLREAYRKYKMVEKLVLSQDND